MWQRGTCQLEPGSPVFKGMKDPLAELGGPFDLFCKRSPPPHVFLHRDFPGNKRAEGRWAPPLGEFPPTLMPPVFAQALLFLLLSSGTETPGTRTVGRGSSMGGVPACQLRVFNVCGEGMLSGRKHGDGAPYTSWFGHFPAEGACACPSGLWASVLASAKRGSMLTAQSHSKDDDV